MKSQGQCLCCLFQVQASGDEAPVYYWSGARRDVHPSRRVSERPDRAVAELRQWLRTPPAGERHEPHLHPNAVTLSVVSQLSYLPTLFILMHLTVFQ